jgi:hypothetical protein
MLDVTKKYKKAIYNPIRKVDAKVHFEVVDPTAQTDNTKSVNSQAAISRLSQITNSKNENSYKYATFEKDYFKLDGSFRIPPKPGEGKNEVGYWSGELSSADGSFTNKPIVRFTFTKMHTSTLTFIWETLSNQFATSLTVKAYMNDTEIHNATIDNDKAITGYDVTIENYNKIEIIVNKWNKPYSRVKLNEVKFGYMKDFTDEEIVNIKLIKQMDSTSNQLASDEMKLTIDNSSREFNILNPNGLYKSLQQRQELTCQFGLELDNGSIEWTSIGKYYLKEWKSNEGSLTTSFTARDILDVIGDIEFNAFKADNLYNIAKGVCIKAGIKDYMIDDSLKGINTQGFKEKLSCRKALQLIGMASKSAVYQDRNGTLQIRPFDVMQESDSHYIYTCGLWDSICGDISILAENGYDMKIIDLDNAYDLPQIKLNDPIKNIVVVINNNSNKTEYLLNNSNIENGKTVKVDNILINTLDHAKGIAKWLMAEYSNRAEYSTKWRQNPILECGDDVLIENAYDSKLLSRITKQEYEYKGYLSGRTTAKGAL